VSMILVIISQLLINRCLAFGVLHQDTLKNNIMMTTITMWMSSTPHVEEIHQPHTMILERIDQIIDSYETKNKALDKATILESVNQDHFRDVSWAKASSLPFESDRSACNPQHDAWIPTEYKTVYAEHGHYALATRTKHCNPLLSVDEIQHLKEASECYWNKAEDEDQTAARRSHFTYQRKGNSEAHLSDVVQHYQRYSSKQFDVASLVNDLLLNRVYPWVREAYLSREDEGNELELFVYDSLFIRYNATAASNYENIRATGAGQPLHRDLGYVSINVMLNEGFEGGGTFFENQLLPLINLGNHTNQIIPLKPVGPGHAIAHYSNERHAGAATFEGIRDILVIFLMVTHTCGDVRKAPRWLCNARLKAAARTHGSKFTNEDQLICRLLHHRLAIDELMDDGEAWHYLGMTLLDYSNHIQLSTDISTVELGVSCLRESIKHNPCDGRLYNNLGLALERMSYCCNPYSSTIEVLREEIAVTYQKSLLLLSACKKKGCDVDVDYASLSLNYGLYLSKLDNFCLAIDVLSRIVPEKVTSIDNQDMLDPTTERAVKDATCLLSFCNDQLKI